MTQMEPVVERIDELPASYDYWSFLLLSAERVKFLCSIGDDYEFICPGPPVYYDPVTYQPAILIDRLHLVYRADFLIRHRENGEAFLVDLHPSHLADDPRLQHCRRIAQGFIQRKNLDWQYRCLFQEYVQLNASQSMLFDSYCRMQTGAERLQWLEQYRTFAGLLKSPSFLSLNYSLLDFLYYGLLP